MELQVKAHMEALRNEKRKEAEERRVKEAAAREKAAQEAKAAREKAAEEARVARDKNSSCSGFFLKFLLSGPAVDGPAPLTVHLHNTQAKVQIQGGAVMPKQTIAAVWFVQSTLKDRFIELAKTKKFAIEIRSFS